MSRTHWEKAEDIVDVWEELEGESMREGHRATLERLIAEALEEVDKRTAETMQFLYEVP